MKLRIGCVVVGFLSLVLSMSAQTAGSSPVSAQVPPPLIQFSNAATDEGGDSMSGIATITFSLYNGQQWGEALWTETQNNVQLDSTGHYSVQLGVTKPNGVPTTLFTTGEARWLGIQIAGQAEQPRVLLLSVPYALKAGDAATIGGLPPSAFVLAAAPNGAAVAYTTESATGQSVSPGTATDVTTSGGTTNYLPLWDSASDIISSVLFQSGTGSTAKIGINTATPATSLDVKGAGTIRGTLSLPATGTATATAGKDSQPLNLTASAYNSSTPAAVNQVFQWQAEPAGNDTSTPSGTLNVLFGEGTTKPSETGLHIASNGQITFATGQTFPGTGTGDGTVTSVGSGLGLKGGPITSSGTLAIDTTVVPQLAAANAFTNNQTVVGNLSATGVVTAFSLSVTGTLGSGFEIGNNLFAFGSVTNSNAFLGFAGNSTMTGNYNTASGVDALLSNSTGFLNTATGIETLASNSTGNYNTASGGDALLSNGTGSFNTGTGYNALLTNTTGHANTGIGNSAGNTVDGSNLTGTNNTALGTGAAFSTGTLTNATAIGANAEVSKSNAMVLGSINGVNGQTVSTNVGIGTTAPNAALDVEGNSVQTLIGDPGCGTGYAGIGFVVSGGFNSCKNYALLGDNPGNVYINSSLSGTIYFRNDNSTLMTIDTSGDVSIKGNLSKGSGSFKIDHPLDPANKYLYHSFVESPDMMNVYNGNVVTNQRGVATVTLPDYFEALNRDFRYQLTVIGQFAQAIVAKEISGNRFTIKTSKPAVKVSWQVTGVRHDAYADAHRIQAEVEKPPQEQGRYLHPELFGAPAEQAIGYHVLAAPAHGESARVSSLKPPPSLPR